MADLSTLIRLHKHELDEKRQALAKLYSEMAAIERQQRDLEFAFEREKEAVSADNEDVHFTFLRYTEQIKRQRKMMEDQKAALEKRISDAKDNMMETFSELKKYEMTQLERDRVEAAERALKESNEMDAIGLEGFRRKSED
jgi:flagellar FliJ protein